MKFASFFTGGITPGTARANKTLVLGATKNIDTIDVAASGFKIGGTAVTATAAELNQVAGGNVTMTRAALAATGADAGGAAVIATQVVAVTASDGTKGVALPAAATTAGPILVVNTVIDATLAVYPVSGGNDNINGGAEDAAFTLGPGQSAWFVPTSATQWYVAQVTGLLATVSELNRVGDVSTRIVSLGATGNITEALHEGKTCLLREVGGNALVTLTMPNATGGGGRYRFVVNEVNTSNYVIQAASGADVFRGCIIGNDGGAVTTTLRWQSGATDDTVTLNGTTSGGAARGDWVEFEDIDTDMWAVRGVVSQSGNEVTPFSDAVA